MAILFKRGFTDSERIGKNYYDLNSQKSYHFAKGVWQNLKSMQRNEVKSQCYWPVAAYDLDFVSSVKFTDVEIKEKIYFLALFILAFLFTVSALRNFA